MNALGGAPDIGSLSALAVLMVLVGSTWLAHGSVVLVPASTRKATG